MTWRQLVIASVAMISLLTTASAAMGYWLWHNVGARLTLKEQSAFVRMPEQLSASVNIENALQVQLNQDLKIAVPFKQRLEIPLDEPLNVQVKVATQVPVALDVPFKQTLKLDQHIDLNSTVTVLVAGVPLEVPVRGKVPLKADIPLDLTIPIRQTIPVKLDAPAQVRLAETLRADVDTQVTAVIPLRETLKLPVASPVQAQLRLSQTPVEAGLQFIDLHVPFNRVSVEPTPLKAGPTP